MVVSPLERTHHIRAAQFASRAFPAVLNGRPTVAEDESGGGGAAVIDLSRVDSPTGSDWERAFCGYYADLLGCDPDLLALPGARVVLMPHDHGFPIGRRRASIWAFRRGACTLVAARHDLADRVWQAIRAEGAHPWPQLMAALESVARQHGRLACVARGVVLGGAADALAAANTDGARPLTPADGRLLCPHARSFGAGLRILLQEGLVYGVVRENRLICRVAARRCSRRVHELSLQVDRNHAGGGAAQTAVAAAAQAVIRRNGYPLLSCTDAETERTATAIGFAPFAQDLLCLENER